MKTFPPKGMPRMDEESFRGGGNVEKRINGRLRRRGGEWDFLILTILSCYGGRTHFCFQQL